MWQCVEEDDMIDGSEAAWALRLRARARAGRVRCCSVAYRGRTKLTDGLVVFVRAQRDKALEVASHVATSTTEAPGTVASVYNELVSQLCRHPSEHMACDDTDEIVTVVMTFLQRLAPIDASTAVGQIDAIIDYVGAQPRHRPLALKLLRAAGNARLRLHVVRSRVAPTVAAPCRLTVLSFARATSTPCSDIAEMG